MKQESPFGPRLLAVLILVAAVAAGLACNDESTVSSVPTPAAPAAQTR